MNKTVEELIADLQSFDWLVRYAAAYALGEMGEIRTPEVVAALTLALHDGNRSVRYVVAYALGRDHSDVEAAIAAGRVCGDF